MKVVFEYASQSIFQISLDFLVSLGVCILLLAFLWGKANQLWDGSGKKLILPILLSVWSVVFFPVRSALDMMDLFKIDNAVNTTEVQKYRGPIHSVKYLSSKLYLVEGSNQEFKMRNNASCFNFSEAVYDPRNVYVEYVVVGEWACAVKVFAY